jgi:hypothetical protein
MKKYTSVCQSEESAGGVLKSKRYLWRCKESFFNVRTKDVHFDAKQVVSIFSANQNSSLVLATPHYLMETFCLWPQTAGGKNSNV